MRNTIEERIKILESDVEKLREIIKMINLEILYNNLIVDELGQLQINYFCSIGLHKLKETERLKELL